MIHHRLRDAVLRFFVYAATRHPRYVVVITILLAVASVYYATQRLQFWTERNQLVSPEAEYNKLFLALREEFGKQEDIVVAFTGPNPEELMAAAEDLAWRLRMHQDVIDHVFYRTDLASLKTKGLYYVPGEFLDKIHASLLEMGPYIGQFAENPGLIRAVQLACNEMDRALKQGRAGGFSGGFDPRFLAILYDRMTARLRGDPVEPLDLEGLFAPDLEGSERVYNFSSDKRFLFMTVMPIEKSSAFHPMLPCIEAIRSELTAITARHPGVEAGLTGSPVLAADEMVDSTFDSIRSTIFSIIGVTILFIVFFRRFTEPFICVLTLFIGICWTIGFTTLTIGHLNLLSVAFCTILIGLGIDFGVHLIYRMQEESREDRSIDDMIRKAIMGAGPGMITGAITTSVAFGMAWFTKFLGIAELGFIAGSGILFCLLAAMTLLPALLRLRGHVIAKPKGFIVQQVRPEHYSAIDQPAFHPVIVLFVAGMFTAVSVYGVWKVHRYDDNLLRLQAEGLPAVKWEHRILREAGQSTWYGALIVDTLDEVKAKRIEFERLPVVSRVDEVTRMMPENQEERQQELGVIREAVAHWPESVTSHEPVDLPVLASLSKRLNFLLGVVESLTAGETRVDYPRESLLDLHRSLNRFLAALESSPATESNPALESVQSAFLESFNRALGDLHATVKASPVTPDDIPEPLRSRFVGRTGKFFLRIYPKEDIWESEQRTRFVKSLRDLDPRVTGSPIQVYESSILMRKGYEEAGLYAFLAMLVLIFIDFQKGRLVLLAMTPLAIGVAWTLGIMAMRQIPFNLANLLAMPLILGIGVDNGIHLVHRFREDGEAAALVSGSTGRAIILCSLTSMIGFGSMIFATHRGISSLGFVLFVGLGSCLVASVTVLPAILHLASLRKWKV